MKYQDLYLEQAKIAKQLNKEVSAVKTLISEVSGYNNTELYLHYDDEVPLEVLSNIIDKLDSFFYNDIPIQYLIGYTYFFGLKLYVDENVLIPRPETELLVEYILNNVIEKDDLSILDIGCGSGAISLALKKSLKNSSLTGVDISKGALNVAIKNKKVNNLDVNFIESNLFENVRSKFDVIVSNPPYIAFDEEVEKIVALNEPTLALYAENNGLYFYEEILKESSNYLLPKFLIAFEIPENKDDLLIELVNKYYPNNHFNIYKDLNDLSRILLIKSDRR